MKKGGYFIILIISLLTPYSSWFIKILATVIKEVIVINKLIDLNDLDSNVNQKVKIVIIVQLIITILIVNYRN